MSFVSLVLWQSFFGNIPMPDDCTYEQFYAAREVLWSEDLQIDLALLKSYENALEKLPDNQELKTMINDLKQQIAETA